MVATVVQDVDPTLDAPIIGNGVIPGAVTVHGQASRETGTTGTQIGDGV
jgi:hypothetical protein